MAQSASTLPRAGYLNSCMDRRFLAETRRKFEELTKLTPTEYFHEAFAGGALNNPYPDFPNFPSNSPPTPNGADYVYGLNGKTINLVFMGWQVHLEHCGGLPDLHNEEIVAAFKKLIDARYFQSKYPNVLQHIFLVQPYATLIDLNGRWADAGIQRLVISTGSFPSFTIDMSAYNRPAASGSIVDFSTITTTFPDDATFTGKLQLPNLIQWSNNTTWTKV
jgi:hypothetical protein